MNKSRLLEEEMGTDDYSRGMKEGNAGIFSHICLQNKKPVREKSFGVLKNRNANYVQLIRSFARITEMEGCTPDKRNDRIWEAWLKFVERRERAFLFGKPSDGDVLSPEEEKRTKTGGFVHWMESSDSLETTIDLNTAHLSKSLFMELVAPLTRGKPGGENSKIVAICGSAACHPLVMLFQKEAAESCWPPHSPYLWRIGISDDVRLEIYLHLLLDDYCWENSVFLITPEDVGMRAAEDYGYGPRIRNVGRPEYHYDMEEEIFAVEGFHMDSPELHRIVKNVRTPR